MQFSAIEDANICKGSRLFGEKVTLVTLLQMAEIYSANKFHPDICQGHIFKSVLAGLLFLALA